MKIVWEGTYNVDGWSIPAGTTKLKQAHQFVRFCMHAARQAQYSSLIANGPNNNDAYKLIDPKRAELLPTYPKNLERLQRCNNAWWGKKLRLREREAPGMDSQRLTHTILCKETPHHG